MSEYYCLVAGLPDVAMDDGKQLFTIDRFREEIYPALSPADARCVNLFFLARDNANLLRVLADGGDAVLDSLGCYDSEQLQSFVAAVKEGDPRSDEFPSYMYDFLDYYFENEQQEGVLWSDVLSAFYYDYAMSSSNKFVASWFEFNLNVNNVLVALLARKHKMPVAEMIVGKGEIADALRSSGARDFGLAGTLDCLDTLIHLSDNDKLQERERQLDELRWKWLDENSVFNYFSIERLFVFLQKLDIISRWAALDSEKGMERYKELIENLKGGAELPAM